MKVKTATNLLKILADESRLTIINLLLSDDKMCASEFLPYLNCKQATLSHHMKELVDNEVVKAKKHGNKVFYKINIKVINDLLNFFIKNTDNNDIKIKETKFIVAKQGEKDKKEDDVPVYLL